MNRVRSRVSTEYRNTRRMRKTFFFVLAIVIVMSTISGCGKKKTAKVVPEVIPIEESGEEGTGIQVTSADTADGDNGSPEEETEGIEEELTVDLTKVRAFDKAKTMYAVSNVNIRKGPSTEFDPLGMIKLGESVEVIGQDEGGWYEFMYHDEIAFACDDYLSDEEPVFEEEEDEEGTGSEVTALDPDAELAAIMAEEELIAIAEAEEAANPPAAIDPANVLIIGDSRSVMMKNATGGGGCSWICQNSKGYKWLESTAIPEAEEMIGSGTKVVIALGVNDVGNVNRYAALVNAKAAEWAERGAVTYYVSVNPVTDNARVSEGQVEFFNNQIKGQLSGIRWIDTHGYLMENGFNATDGVHYDNATSKKIFQAIMDRL